MRERHKLDLDKELEKLRLVSDLREETDTQELNQSIPHRPLQENKPQKPTDPEGRAGDKGVNERDRVAKMCSGNREKDNPKCGGVDEDEADDGKGMCEGEDGEEVEESNSISAIKMVGGEVSGGGSSSSREDEVDG